MGSNTGCGVCACTLQPNASFFAPMFRQDYACFPPPYPSRLGLTVEDDLRLSLSASEGPADMRPGRNNLILLP